MCNTVSCVHVLYYTAHTCTIGVTTCSGMYVWPLWVAGMSVGKPQGVGQTTTHNHWPKARLAWLGTTHDQEIM